MRTSRTPAASRRSAWPALLVLLLGLAPTAWAFPPAPTFTIRGVARDEFGWAIKATDQAIVVIKRDGVEIAEAPIDETGRSDENFRVLLPMDMSSANPYRTGAQTTGSLVSIEVRFPTTTMPVAFLKSKSPSVGKPGDVLFIDFSVGADTDGDGIPDAWEWWQLSQAGIGPGDARWSLATLGKGDFDGDGTSDYVEYLAGTFAVLNSDHVSLKITGFDTDGSAVLAAFCVIDKTYRVEYSQDLKKWTRGTLRYGDPGSNTFTDWTATDTQEVTLKCSSTIGLKQVFYRLVTER